MKNKLDIEEVRKIARLSALELTDKELKIFVKQFSEILNYFDLLNKVDIEQNDEDVIEENTHRGREDKVYKSSVFPEQFSPYIEDKFFKIPLVIDQEK